MIMPKTVSLRKAKHLLDAWQAHKHSSQTLRWMQKQLPTHSMQIATLIECNQEGFKTFPMKPYVELAKLLVKQGHEIFLEQYDAFIANKYDGKRGDMNFIDGFLEFTKEAESPTSFLRWAAITTLSATLRDNTWWPVGMGQRIYPNIYTILVARSGACKKGLPLKIANGLLSKIQNTKMTAGRTSIQKVIQKMAETQTRATKGPGGHLIQGGSLILYSEELATLIVDDPATIPLLTDLYDYHEEYVNDLVAAGSITIKDSCLTLLAASNEEFLREIYTKRAQYGGLLGRTFLIMEQKRRQKNSRMYFNEENTNQPLIDHLIKVAQLRKGPAFIPDETKKAYDDWYNTIEDDESSKSGMIERLGTHVQKVCLALAAAEPDFGDRLIIYPRHFEEAKELCTGLINNYEFFMMGASQTVNSKIAPQIIKDLLVSPEFNLPRSKVVRKYMTEVDMNQYKQVEQQMLDAGIIEIKTGKRSVEPHIYLTSRVLDEIRKEAEKQ